MSSVRACDPEYHEVRLAEVADTWLSPEEWDAKCRHDLIDVSLKTSWSGPLMPALP